MVLDCFTNPESALCPFSSSSDVFYSPFPHPFPAQTHGGTSPTNSGQTGAQGTTRMLPRLCEPPVIMLGGSRVSCRGSGLGQRKSALHHASLRRGHYLPHAPLGMQGSGTAGNLSLQVVPASGHGGASAQHHGGSAHSAILLCRNVTRDHFSSTFSPHPSGEREPQTAVYCP